MLQCPECPTLIFLRVRNSLTLKYRESPTSFFKKLPPGNEKPDMGTNFPVLIIHFEVRCTQIKNPAHYFLSCNAESPISLPDDLLDNPKHPNAVKTKTFH
jgi:hypothetical protein